MEPVIKKGTVNKWSDYERQQNAFQEAKDAQKKTVAEKESIKPGPLAKAGTKRKRETGKTELPPLDGLSQKHSDVIRDFVSHRHSGYTVNAAAEKVVAGGLLAKVDSVIRIVKKNPAGVEQAEKEIRSRTLVSYHQNVEVMRLALSEAAPRAISTIVEIMDDPSVAAGTRLKASVELLKMLNVSGKAASGKEEMRLEFAEAMREARRDVQSDRIIVVEADDAEVIEDGDAGDSCPDESDGREYQAAAQA